MKNKLSKMKFLTLLGALFLFGLPSVAFGQASRQDGVVASRNGRPAPGATIAVCAETANVTTTPCSTLATLYTDSTMTVACSGTLSPPAPVPGGACSNPMISDGLGNYHFYAQPGRYAVQFYGSSLTTYAQRDDILPCDPTNCTSICNYNGMLTVGGGCSVLWGNGDIGSQINTAYGLCPSTGCTILISAGTYAYTTNVLLTTSGKWVAVVGNPGSVVNLIFSGSGNAFTLDYVPAGGGGWKTGHGLRNFNLYNKTTTQIVGGPNKAIEITAWSITSNVVTFTINSNAAGANPLIAGNVVTLNGFQFNASSSSGQALFNNQQVTVISTGLSSTQFEANFTHANTSLTEYGFAYTTTETNVGVSIGPNNSGSLSGTYTNVQVSGFFKGIQFNNPTGGTISWGEVFDQVSIVGNTFGYWFPDSLSFLENLHVRSGLIAWNALGIYMGYGALIDFYIDGPSLDSNTITGFDAPFGGSYFISTSHLENNGLDGNSSAHYINSGPGTSIELRSSELLKDGVATVDWLMRVNGGSSAFYVQNCHLFAGGVITQFFKIESGAAGTISCDIGSGSASTKIWNFDSTTSGTVNQIFPTLNRTIYQKGSGAGNYTTTSLTPAVVDGTNLSLTIVIPHGYTLLIQVSGNLGNNTGFPANGATANLTDTSTATILQSITSSVVGAGDANPFSLLGAIVGDGASHVIQLQFLTGNAGDPAVIYNSGGLFPVMLFHLIPST